MSSTTTSTSAAADRVAAAMAVLDREYADAAAMVNGTDTEHAARAAALALVCARLAGWWRVLERHAYTDPDTPSVYGHAALIARHREIEAARFWRQTAADWTARATGNRHGSGLWADWDHLHPTDHDHDSGGPVQDGRVRGERPAVA